MLSARGALNTASILMEVAIAQPKDSKRIFLLSEAEKVWAALSKVIRFQMTQGGNVCVPKLGSFWFDQKHLVSDGPTKYFTRIPQFGFNALYGTTFGLDPVAVPRESVKVIFEKLAVDQIAEAANVPASTALLVLSEVFLFIGEGLFLGKVFHLEFPQLASILVKREKCQVTFDADFASDIYTIDSRKWPLAVKEVAAMGMRPPPATQPRPRSASSRPATPREVEPKSAFVSSAPNGRLFSELVNRPTTGKKAPTAKTAQKPGGRQPLKASLKKALDNSQIPDEESVYDILSPSRQQPMTLDDCEPLEAAPHFFHRRDANDADVIDDGSAEQLIPEIPAIVHQQAHVSAAHPAQSQNIRDVLFGDHGPIDSRPKSGRRRFAPQPNQVAALFDA
jgi:hypothetical protein